MGVRVRCKQQIMEEDIIGEVRKCDPLEVPPCHPRPGLTAHLRPRLDSCLTSLHSSGIALECKITRRTGERDAEADGNAEAEEAPARAEDREARPVRGRGGVLC